MDENERLQFMNQQLKILESNKNQLQAQQALSMFQKDDEDKKNIMESVLNSDKILQRIETFLRQLRPQKTDKGYILSEPLEKDRLLNETGVNEIMAQLAWYITPDVILSNYTEEEVRVIVHQFGIEFSDFVYVNMERFGMGNRIKQRSFTMLCLNVINIVDATYHRSIGGKALEALNKSVMVTQSDPLSPGISPIQRKSLNILKPSTWKNAA